MRKRPSMVDMPPPATEESAALRIVIAADGSGWPASERMTPPILPGPLPGPGVWALNCAATAHIEMKTNRIRRKGAFRETRNDAMKFNSSQGLRRSEEHTSELQSQSNLVCRLLLEKKK